MPGDPGHPVEHLSEHCIEAHTSLVDRALRTLKQGDAFAVLDTYGDCGTVPDSPEGLFFRDTRYLSHFELRLHGHRPLLLGSVIQDDNAALTSTCPVACSPQAWAAATPLALLWACMGLELDLERDAVRFNSPILPAFLDKVTIAGLRLGSSSFDLRFSRAERDVTLNVVARTGTARVLLSK